MKTNQEEVSPNDQAQLRATNDAPSTESATGALAAAPCSARLDVRRWIEQDGRPVIYKNGRKQGDFEVESLFPLRFKALRFLTRLTDKLRSHLSHTVYGLQNK